MRWVYILAVIAALDGLILGSLSLSLAFNELKVRNKYFEDLGGSDPFSEYQVYGGYHDQHRPVSSSHLGHTNLGFSSDTLSVYSKHHQPLYMTPHGEDDRCGSLIMILIL